MSPGSGSGGARGQVLEGMFGVEEWVLEFGIWTISLSSVRFPPVLVLLFFEYQWLMILK